MGRASTSSKTDDRERWTFPKGKLKAGESPDRAAIREAREEAGVEGRLEPFTVYRYPASHDGCDDLTVEAFLLEVREIGEQAPGDRHRDRGWFNAKEATKALRRKRSGWRAKELERVIDEAVRILERES